MRIIQLGDMISGPWEPIVSCSNCKTEVQLEAKDVIRTLEPGDYRNDSYFKYGWNCPGCKEHNFIYNDNLKSLLFKHPELV